MITCFCLLVTCFCVLVTCFCLQISLDLNASEKFGCLLHSVLVTLSQLLEVASIHEVGKHADELLGYLKATMSRAPIATVNCVQQVRVCVLRV